MRRLRILQIFSRYIHFGGEEGFVDSFRNASLPFHDVTDYQGSTEELLGRSFSNKLMLPVRAFHSSRVANELRHLQKKGSFDLWVIQNALPGLSPSVYQTAFDLKVPVVHYLHNYRMGCTNGFFLNHGQPCERCLGGNFWPAFQTACWRNSRIISGFMGLILRRVRSVGLFCKVPAWISISDFQKKKHVAMGIPAERIHTIHHFYESSSPPPPTPTSGDTLFLGRLSQEKGVDLLLRAWAMVKNKNRRLVVAGTGPEESYLKKLASDLNLANVVFTGFLDKEQQVSLWSNSSALVVPSIWDEPFGMVVLEAWAKERPVVAYAKGALPELIQHGVNGLLADPFSVEALANNIQELIEKPDLGLRLGKAGNLRLKNEFNRTLWLSRIESVYQKVVPV
ncbi:MAG: glycosyltransferase family 4 protein [Candidatus Pacebacteria bacterium]|nr:glycosyltransferase family 4 protein [Candidatus Paceibacterota bacterium]